VKVIEVLWNDAWIDVHDVKLKKAKKFKPVVRSTIGFLVKEKNDCLVLCTDFFEKGKEISAPMVIPRGMIIDYWEYADYEDKD